MSKGKCEVCGRDISDDSPWGLHCDTVCAKAANLADRDIDVKEIARRVREADWAWIEQMDVEVLRQSGWFVYTPEQRKKAKELILKAAENVKDPPPRPPYRFSIIADAMRAGVDLIENLEHVYKPDSEYIEEDVERET